MNVEVLKGNPLPWLLEPDPQVPGVRYFALRDLLGRPEGDPEVRRARGAIMETGPVPQILDAQYPQGYWVKHGGGYSPKYRSTIWQILFLAQLGADPTDERVRRGCEYVLNHSIASNGAFSCYQTPTPEGGMLCLNGNLLHALIRLGYLADPRVEAALDWMARAITGESIRYPGRGTQAPGFVCSANEGLPCAWGAVKGMKALLLVPPARRSPRMERAMEAGQTFLLSRDPAQADYAPEERISPKWFQLGFPLPYWSDVLELTTVLADLGHGDDPRLEKALGLILSKQDESGCWKLENSINDRMWAAIERKGKPSKWVTLRALRLLVTTQHQIRQDEQDE